LYVLKEASQKFYDRRIEEYVKDFLETMHTDMIDFNDNKNIYDVRKKLKDVKNLTMLLGNITPKRKLIFRQKKGEGC